MFLTECVRSAHGPNVQYFPQHLSQWFGALQLSGEPIDAFWGSCSPPDERGFVSLSPSHPASIVNDPYRIAQNYQMVSINSAVEIDLTGQVCSKSVGHRELSGIGGASDTHVGAQRSQGGRGIIAMRSMASHGIDSKIVFELKPGAKVSISRNDIDTVVTEYGVARLKGKTLSERVKLLTSLAHPSVREKLLSDARRASYL